MGSRSAISRLDNKRDVLFDTRIDRSSKTTPRTSTISSLASSIESVRIGSSYVVSNRINKVASFDVSLHASSTSCKNNGKNIKKASIQTRTDVLTEKVDSNTTNIISAVSDKLVQNIYSEIETNLNKTSNRTAAKTNRSYNRSANLSIPTNVIKSNLYNKVPTTVYTSNPNKLNSDSNKYFDKRSEEQSFMPVTLDGKVAEVSLNNISSSKTQATETGFEGLVQLKPKDNNKVVKKANKRSNVTHKVNRRRVRRKKTLFEQIFGAKLVFDFNRKTLVAGFNSLVLAGLLVIGGYLVWDTWLTNKPINVSATNSSVVKAISSVNPLQSSQMAISREEKAKYVVGLDQPRFLDIPSLNINTRVYSAGLNSSGEIDTPKNVNDAVWYDGSAKPSQNGQVFIGGSVSFDGVVNSSFTNIKQIKKDDLISIELGSGQKVNYKVTNIQIAKSEDINMSKALATQPNSPKGLTLMICTGTYNYRLQNSDERVVIYAVQN